MSTLQTWSPWISPLAEKLARQLTVRREIPEGSGLAIYLDIDRFYSNHHAIRIWVQRMLDNDPTIDSVDCLILMFIELIPYELLY
jgi:hypothetical protein